MKFLKKLFERRAVPSDPYWSNFAALRSGTAVTPQTAESISAVYACVAAIAETVGSLPLHLYRRTGGEARERVTDHPLARVLHDAPNPRQGALEFREQMQAAVLLRGNAFAHIIAGSDGQVSELWPLHPDSVTVLELDSRRLAYDVTDGKGRTQRLLQEEVFHLRHRSDNGILGVSPVQAARDVLELALHEREHGNATFRQGTRLSGICQTDKAIEPSAILAFRETWEATYGGASNAGKVALLGMGAKFTPLSMSLEDAEWVAARQFSVEEVARLFRVPPTVIGDLRHGNYSNSVEMSRVFVTHTLRRHLVAWEQAIARQLLTEAGRRTYFAEHSVEGLLRGDSLNRAQFYKHGIDDGWLTVDEVRRFESLPPIDERSTPKPFAF